MTLATGNAKHFQENMTHITLIAAMTKTGVIGYQSQLPWKIPSELAYFKEATMGKPVVMGRKTFESLKGRPLPGRQMIVLSKTQVKSVEEVLRLTKDAPEIMIIGGAQVYEAFLPIADELRISIIKGDYKGDTYFPSVDWSKWQLAHETEHADFTIKHFHKKI